MKLWMHKDVEWAIMKLYIKYIISEVYLCISMPSTQMTTTTPVRRREENAQENMLTNHDGNDGGDVDGDACWSR